MRNLIAAALLLAAAPLGAQDDPAPAAPSRGAGLHVLAFVDTAGVRFEGTLTPSARLDGATARATITSLADGSLLWQGELGRLGAAGPTGSYRLGRASGLRPRLWSPSSPSLYRAIVEVAGPGGPVADTVRIGFRTVASSNGRILLNGRPVFLRGNAINPPGRQLPDSLAESPAFARDYIRFMKGVGVNIIRLTTPSQAWFDVADEEGMMIFQGHYGTPKGGTSTSPPKDAAAAVRWYRDEVLGPQVNHPSVVVYALSNEQASADIHYLSKGNAEVTAFLERAHEELRAWDDTRLYIGNAGYGFGRAGEICDLHRYWGWYYNSFLSFYTLRDPRICWRSSAVQPMTLTENTGNYTGPDGRYNLVSDTKQPDSQLNWTGHAPDAEQPARALAYQAWMGGQAIEITRRLRERNPYLAGLSPFTIAFSNWYGIRSFADMGPKPITAQYARSYQPVLLSWESWTPHAYAGATIRPVAHVVNDAESGEALRGATLRWVLADSAGRAVAAGRVALGTVPYYGASSTPVAVAIPAALPTGRYTLAGAIVRGASDTVSRNETRLLVAARGFAGGARGLARRVRLYDPSGRTASAFRALGVPFTAATRVAALDPARDALVVGAAAWGPALSRDSAALRAFLARGGRAVVLEQRAASFSAPWLPGGVQLQTTALDHPNIMPGGRPFAQGMAINPERPAHPVFDGLTRDHFFLWSDHTGWNESKPGFPAVYPVAYGYALRRPAEMGDVALLADYDHGLEGVALAEFFVGEGSALLSGFDLVPRLTRDPVADRFLMNLVRYAAGEAPHDAHPLVTSAVTWGDYASEQGLVTGIHSGFILHTVPRVPEAIASSYPLRMDDDGFVVAGAGGGWNTKPAIQYFGRGRRPFGPYTFSYGGSVQAVRGQGRAGEGRVWLRVPAGRGTMVTTATNPTGEPLDLEVGVNGAVQRASIAPGAVVRIASPLVASPLPAAASRAAADRTLALTFRGDRRLVILTTEFQ